MKRIFKNVGIGALLLIGILIAFANFGRIYWEKKQRNYSKTLEGMVAEINRHLPMKDPNGFDFYVMNRVKLEGENVVWESTLDTTFFYPIRESILPESMNGGILAYGSRNDVLDLDTILSKEMLKESHRCDILYYHLFSKGSNPNPFYDEVLKRGY